MLNYLPSQVSADNDFATSPLTYHVASSILSFVGTFKQFRRSCTYEIYPVYFIRKNSKLNYLRLQLPPGNDLASCPSTYHVLPLFQVSLKTTKWFKEELGLPYVMDRQTESWIISCYNCPLEMILLHVHQHIKCYHYFKFHWKPPSNLGEVALTRCNGQTDRKLNYLPLKLSAGNELALWATTILSLRDLPSIFH